MRESQTFQLLAAILGSLTVVTLGALIYDWIVNRARQSEVVHLLDKIGLDAGGADLHRRSVFARWSDLIAKTRWGRRLDAQLRQADLPLKSSQYVVVLFGIGILLFLAIGAIYQLAPLLNLVVTLAVTSLGSKLFLDSRRDHYTEAFSSQMPEVALLVSNSLKAGLSVPQAFGIVAEKMKQPAGVEFGRVSREIRLGLPLDEALQRMVERLPIEELRIMVVTILINRKGGGDLSRALAVMSSAITARHALRGEISALTAEGRFSSVAILVMPFAILAILNLMMPGSVADFFNTPIGWIVVIIFVMAQAVAFVLINRIANVKV